MYFILFFISFFISLLRYLLTPNRIVSFFSVFLMGKTKPNETQKTYKIDQPYRRHRNPDGDVDDASHDQCDSRRQQFFAHHRQTKPRHHYQEFLQVCSYFPSSLGLASFAVWRRLRSFSSFSTVRYPSAPFMGHSLL